MHAPASAASANTEARQVSTEIGTSKRAASASTAGTTRSSSSASETSVARAGLHPADVEGIGAIGDELGGLAEERVEPEVRALVEERVGRSVEDAQHHGPRGDVEGVGAEGQQHDRRT